MIQLRTLLTFAALSSSTALAKCVRSPSSTSSISSAAPTCTTTPGQFVQNPGFEDSHTTDGSSSYDGYPWTLSNSTAAYVVPSSQYAPHSGSESLFMQLTSKLDPPVTVTQTLSGLDTTAQYTLTFYYAATNNEFLYTSSTYLKVYLDGQMLDIVSQGLNYIDAGAYQEAKVILQPASANPTLTISFVYGSGDYFGYAEMLLDDITVTNSCPPCTLVSPTPEGVTCAAEGYISYSYNYAISGTYDASSVSGCALSCAQTASCQTFYWRGPDSINSASCLLFSEALVDLPFVSSQGNEFVYQSQCFQCNMG